MKQFLVSHKISPADVRNQFQQTQTKVPLNEGVPQTQEEYLARSYRNIILAVYFKLMHKTCLDHMCMQLEDDLGTTRATEEEEEEEEDEICEQFVIDCPKCGEVTLYSDKTNFPPLLKEICLTDKCLISELKNYAFPQ